MLLSLLLLLLSLLLLLLCPELLPLQLLVFFVLSVLVLQLRQLTGSGLSHAGGRRRARSKRV